MNFISLIAALSEKGIQLWLENGLLRFSAPKGVLSEDLRLQLQENKPALIEFLKQQKSLPEPVASMTSGQHQPLSFSQQRLWFLNQLSPENPAYHINTAFKISGALNMQALEASLNYLLQRHSILHHSYQQIESGICQSITAPQAIKLNCIASMSSSDDAIRHGLANSCFNLECGEVFYHALYPISDDNFVLFFSIHHIACDGTSMVILADELSHCYNGFAHKLQPNLAAVPLNYIDYALWQQSLTKEEAMQYQLDYWQAQLSDNQALTLAYDFKRPLLNENPGASSYCRIEKKTVLQLRTLAQSKHISLFNTLLAIFATLLQRYSAQDTFSIGIASAGRNHPLLESVFGCFVNMLAIKINFNDALNFDALLEQVQHSTEQALQHQDLPFEQLVQRLDIARDLSSTAVFQTLFSLQSSADFQQAFDGLEVAALAIEKNASQYEISLYANEMADGSIELEWLYRSDLFKPARIEQMAQHFLRLCQLLCLDSSQQIAALNLHSSDDLKKYQQLWQSNQHDFGKPQCLDLLFDQQVAKTPQAIAVSDGKLELSYAQLHAQSTELADFLQTQLDNEQALHVGIFIDRSMSMLVAILATLKAGAVYIPIDTTLPKLRLQALCADAQLQCLLSHSELATTVELACAEFFVDSLPSYATAPKRAQLLRHSEQLCNIIYTSGSTGSPKGVMVSHAALFNRLRWMQAQFPLEAGEKVLHKTPISFDVSVWEIFWPLLNGGQIVLAEVQGHKNPQYLAKLIEQERIQYCHFVPSMLSVFLEQMQQADCSSLRRVFCSGEALSASHSQAFYQRFKQCELYNLYGPTEAAIDVSYYHCLAQDNDIPIGRAISNTQLQLTNPLGQLAPMGAIAEISIGGANLAQAYWGNAEATAAAFISNPLQAYGHPSRLLYKTGDLGYFDAQQQLHFVGRRDRQVKIRGFRIELAEIEQCLRQLASIKDAAVSAINGPDGNAQLAAYCISAAGLLDSSELQQHLAAQLPSYMTPSYFIEIDNLPQLSSGKIAYHLLPAPQSTRQNRGEYIAARNEIEEKLQAIWQALLNVDKISVYDNFFELGGHSLLAAQALNQCQRTFDIQIKLSDVLQDPTIATAARIIAQSLAHKNIISDNNNSDDEEEITL